MKVISAVIVFLGICFVAVVVSTFLLIGNANAACMTLPNSNVCDYSQSQFVRKGDTIYQTLPNSSVRNYTVPHYVVQKDGGVYQTLPNSNVRDYRAPSYRK